MTAEQELAAQMRTMVWLESSESRSDVATTHDEIWGHPDAGGLGVYAHRAIPIDVRIRTQAFHNFNPTKRSTYCWVIVWAVWSQDGPW